MKKYKVTITLKSGIVRMHRCKAESKDIDKTLKMIDDAWKNSNIDGYVSFNNHYYRVSDISHYHLEKAWYL